MKAKKLYTIKEAAAILEINYGTLYSWIYTRPRGLPEPKHKLNGSKRTFYTAAEIEKIRKVLEQQEAQKGGNDEFILI